MRKSGVRTCVRGERYHADGINCREISNITHLICAASTFLSHKRVEAKISSPLAGASTVQLFFSARKPEACAREIWRNARFGRKVEARVKFREFHFPLCLRLDAMTNRACSDDGDSRELCAAQFGKRTVLGTTAETEFTAPSTVSRANLASSAVTRTRYIRCCSLSVRSFFFPAHGLSRSENERKNEEP